MNNLFTSDDGRLRPIWRFAVSLVVVFFANWIAFVFGIAAGRQGSALFNVVYWPAMVVLLIAGYSLLLRTVDQVDGRLLPAMGLNGGGQAAKDAAIGLVLGFAMVSLAVGILVISGTMGPMVRHFTTGALRQQTIALIILLAGAMSEELMFRGYPFQRLVDAIGPVTSTLVLSGLFGFAHLWNPGSSFIGFVNTALVGALFAMAYLRTRSLWLPWGLHFSWNATLGVLFGLPVSGLSDFSIVMKSSTRGATWLTGGSYGIEAGLSGTLVILLGFVALLFLVPNRSKQVPEAEPDFPPDVPTPAF